MEPVRHGCGPRRMSLIDSSPSGSPTFPDDPDATLYGQLLRAAARSGRCPVWLGPTALEGAGVLGRPDDVIGEIDATDADVVLARWWPGPCHPECPCGEQLPAEPPEDPARDTDLSRSAETFAAAAAHLGDPGPLAVLAVVDATRPADVPAALGWSGICNYHPYQDLVSISAVLRRWEERWGALLVDMDRSRLHLSVAHPPMSDAECLNVAGEHFAFCPDQQDPQNGRIYTLRTYAQTIRGARSWHFWWD